MSLHRLTILLCAGRARQHLSRADHGRRQPPQRRRLPLHRRSVDFGNSARLARSLAVSEINEAGGCGHTAGAGGARRQGQPDEGRRIAEELVLQKKPTSRSASATPASPPSRLDVFQDNKRLLMIPVATGTVLTAKVGGLPSCDVPALGARLGCRRPSSSTRSSSAG